MYVCMYVCMCAHRHIQEGAASLLQLRRGAAALGSGALLGRLGELSASLREALRAGEGFRGFLGFLGGGFWGF